MNRRILLLVAALPIVMGSYCGIAFDFTETFLITDPVTLIVIDVDDGNIDAVAYDRPAILLKRHQFGIENVLGEPTFTVENGVASFEAHCKKQGHCTYDHMLELPFGVGFDITMLDARIDIGYVDADIVVDIQTGFFHGVRLAVPHLELSARAADLELDYAVAPQTITIDLDRGDVMLALPAGEYQCRFEGSVTMEPSGVVCNDAAVPVLDVATGNGEITVTEALP